MLRSILLCALLAGCAPTPPDPEVVIVPGAGIRGGRPGTVLEERLDCALEAYREDPARRILVSGDHGRRHHDEVNVMRRYLRRHGVPNRDVFMDHAGFRTLDTMERAHRVFGVRRAIVCTQALYAPRALLLAENAGIDAHIRVAGELEDAGERRVARETFAMGRALIDVVVGTEPAALGNPIPIEGDARATHDRATTR